MKTQYWEKVSILGRIQLVNWKKNKEVEIGRQGEYPNANERKEKEVEVRLIKKLDGIIHLREVMHEHRDYFNLADYVEGGYQNLPRQEWSMVDYDYLRSVAKEYYIHLIIFLTRSLDASVHHYFTTFITSESNFQQEISKSLMAFVNGLKDEELKEMSNVNEEFNQNEYDSKKLELEHLKTLVPKITTAVQALLNTSKNKRI